MINQIEPVITEEDILSVDEYLRSGGWLTEHSLTKKLEKEISDYLERSYAVAVPNGTVAIYMALKIQGLGPGDRVVVPNITMIATINAVIWAGAEPVLVDVDENLCMSVDLLKTVNKPDAVIFVPLNGRTGNGLQIEEWCLENGVILIEDSAHALGSQYSEKKCGSLGNMSILSFTPHKIITSGQGGLILTDDEDSYTKMSDYKSFNRTEEASDIHKGFGLNFKFTDLQSSLLLSQLARLDSLIESKKSIYSTYVEYTTLSEERYLKFQDFETPWFIDYLLMKDEEQDKYRDLLLEKNIQIRKGYPPLSSQPMFREVERTDLTYSEEIANRIVWLPSSTNLSKDDLKLVSSSLDLLN